MAISPLALRPPRSRHSDAESSDRTTMEKHCDVAIIGAGIVGLAVGLQLLRKNPGIKVIVLDKEGEVAAHQTGHNSGVIHSGLYYKPGSLKAQNCTIGREQMYRFCQEHGIAHDR